MKRRESTMRMPASSHRPAAAGTQMCGVLRPAVGVNRKRSVGRLSVPRRGLPAASMRVDQRRALLERAVILRRVDEIRSCLELSTDPTATEYGACPLERAVLDSNPTVICGDAEGEAIVQMLLGHPRASRAGANEVFRRVLVQGTVPQALLLARLVFNAFGAGGLEVSSGEMVRAFQIAGSRRQEDLYHPNGGLALATLLLSTGAPLPPSAFLLFSTIESGDLSKEDEEELSAAIECGENPGLRLLSQCVYQKARRRLQHSRGVLLVWAASMQRRGRSFEGATLGQLHILPAELLLTIASYGMSGDPSLYPKAKRRVT
eukprot:TRINITY_DN3950_c2_g2_i1.p1 TRINITY_DN3950_c2_g2~~TRINITY_DN3950_c2_g2_i1.p1  ORF type:complete len:338 (+),score=43.35 TRINITY_DN3950_c2_g2_i1:62-1015(+)